jgi:hypothetical protein
MGTYHISPPFYNTILNKDTLLKIKMDAKFYAIHISPSESELWAMGNTE